MPGRPAIPNARRVACRTLIAIGTSTSVNGRYVFTPDLRRTVIFGRNDLTSDAPISRIDILLCRNTLMYLNVETRCA